MRRGGYTLLEVILAIGIGLVLVAGLYVALDVQMRYIQAGRQIVAEAQLARGVLDRIGSDMRSQLALLPMSASLMTLQQQVDAQSSGASGASSSSSGSSGGSSSGSSSSSNSGSSGSSAASQSAEDPSQAVQVNFGLTGDETTLTLTTNATPRYSLIESQTQITYCDQRQVLYYFQPGLGLMRQEIRNVLGTQAGDLESPPEAVAPEVQDLRFRYFDGSTWSSAWDQGAVFGPPLAIEITITLQPPLETMTGRYANRAPMTQRLVVTVPTAVVFPQPGTAGATGTTSGAPSTGGLAR
jgi:hypothetical protein